jgi:hypothetical protein
MVDSFEVVILPLVTSGPPMVTAPRDWLCSVALIVIPPMNPLCVHASAGDLVSGDLESVTCTISATSRLLVHLY